MFSLLFYVNGSSSTRSALPIRAVQGEFRHLRISGVSQEVGLVEKDGVELVGFHKLLEFIMPAPKCAGISEGDLQGI